MSELLLAERDRDAPVSPGQKKRARYVAWLDQPLKQLDFTIDGVLLSERLRTLEVPRPDEFGLDPFDMLSVVDVAWPAEAASSLRQLAGVEPRSLDWPLAPGRLPLYVCQICADIGCGAITVEVARPDGLVAWQDFRMENGYTEQSELIDLGGLGPFTFDADGYRTTLLLPTPVLYALDADERAARAQWRHRRGIRGMVNRLRRDG